MMLIYPAHAAESLEFNKVIQLLKQKCRTDTARETVSNMRFHTRLEYVAKALQQTYEYTSVIRANNSFPNDFTRNIEKELKLLAIPGAVLDGDQLLACQRLALCIRDILTWFKNHDNLYGTLREASANITYEKEISAIIGSVVDDQGQVKDSASRELMAIRADLSSKRNELRKLFEGVLRKLNKQGYLADISEGFLNGRRVVAVGAEHKRIVKGILHGESDSQRTVFI